MLPASPKYPNEKYLFGDDVVETVDVIDVVVRAAEHPVVAGPAVERVLSLVAEQRVDAARTNHDVVARVAASGMRGGLEENPRQHEVEPIVEEGEVLDIGPERVVGQKRLDLIYPGLHVAHGGAGADETADRAFENLVAGADTIGVVAGPAIQPVGFAFAIQPVVIRAAVEPVSSAAADQRVIAVLTIESVQFFAADNPVVMRIADAKEGAGADILQILDVDASAILAEIIRRERRVDLVGAAVFRGRTLDDPIIVIIDAVEVVAAAANHDVVAGVADQRIVAVFAEQEVVVITAVHVVIVCAAVQNVDVVARPHDVVADAAFENVVAGSSVQRVVAAISQNMVVPAMAEQFVTSVTVVGLTREADIGTCEDAAAADEVVDVVHVLDQVVAFVSNPRKTPAS